MTDTQIRQDVIDALDWDPSVDAINIGVGVDKGVVVLSGQVTSMAEKIAAQDIARRVKGVVALADEIQVCPTSAHADAEIAAEVAEAISLDVLVPPGAVQVMVTRGWVTLLGEVGWSYQRRAAEGDVHRLKGVTGVSNKIRLKPNASADDVAKSIEAAFRRNAEIEASRIHVGVRKGEVTLTGLARTLREREAAEQAAWSAPGVHAVVDHIQLG